MGVIVGKYLLVTVVCIFIFSYQHILKIAEENSKGDIISAAAGTIPSKNHNFLSRTELFQLFLESQSVPELLPSGAPDTLNGKAANSTGIPEVQIGLTGITTGVLNGKPSNPKGHCLPQNSSLPPCPPIPTNLVGRLHIDLRTPSWSEMANMSFSLEPGGGFSPHDCVAKDKVALVLPYRNRPEQLRTFLNHIHPILMRQNIQYQIFIVNQAGDNIFNRGMLFNIGFVEAMKLCDWNCIVFHDVDLLPEDDRNLYTCPKQPRHLSVAVNKFNYKLPYAAIFGGAGVLTTEHFRLVNGFSNQFWGWGGEDDNMNDRIRHNKLKITRYKNEIARYTMIKHSTEVSNKRNPQRFNLRKTGKAIFDKDGLNNLQYKLVSIQFENVYTNLTVIIDKINVTK